MCGNIFYKLQFVLRHFTKCYQALAPYLIKEYKANCQRVLSKIAEAIEHKYGRLKPHLADKEGFEENKRKYYECIFRGPHFSDKNGITFLEFIKPEQLTRKNCESNENFNTLIFLTVGCFMW